MKLKNLGTTVINVGKVIILPDETVEVKDKAYENNAAINYLVKTNRLALVKEEAKKDKKNAGKKAETPAEEPKTPSEETKTETPAATETEQE